MSDRIPAGLARRIRLVLFDVDGVLTDGGLYIGRSEKGDAVELKRFDITDGLGVHMLVWSGLRVALVSGRESPATRLRAAELGIECYEDAGARKIPLVAKLVERHGVSWDEVAFVADDLADLPVLRRVGLPVAVANAVPEVRAACRWVTSRPGGHGAVREFAEALLKARGEWGRLVDEYCRIRSGEVETTTEPAAGGAKERVHDGRTR
ncbi:MAG: HAD-IIIA family hydrolase [bacterium]|jgi:3-deoxy-D-manno-octulosonate 8-phosphate phosphatase (KDO 8-P phosphatase)